MLIKQNPHIFFVVAFAIICYCTCSKETIKQDDKNTFEQYLKNARQGITQMQYEVGACYSNGMGVTRNDKKAFIWTFKAAENGHIMAQHDIGVYYATGQGTTINYKKAFEWFMKAANQGHADAQFNIGVCYKKGNYPFKSTSKVINIPYLPSMRSYPHSPYLTTSYKIIYLKSPFHPR